MRADCSQQHLHGKAAESDPGRTASLRTAIEEPTVV